MADPTPSPEGRFLTFRLKGQLYALPADEVAEVIRPPVVARVPQGPRSLMGLGNLRGTVIPVASGRGLLGHEEAPPLRAIVLSGPAPVAVAVDDVEGLVSVAPGKIATDQAELAREPGERLRGAFEADAGGEVAKILDLWPLLESGFVQSPRAPRGPAPTAAGLAGRVAQAGHEDGERIVTFMVAGQEFGLPLEDVVEIIPPPASLAASPRAEALVLGIASYREGLLPILSLRGLLGLPASAQDDDRAKVVVVSVGGALTGLAVDGVRAILAADPALVEPTPPVLAARIAGEAQVKAIYRGDAGARLVSILSKDQLFREDVMQRLSSAGAPARPVAAETAAAAELRFLVFRLGDDEFALPIDAVDEVARVPEQITRVPKTPKFLEGVVNLRGEVLPVVDQRRRFDMSPAPDAEARRLVIVRTESQRAGVIVDSVSEVLRSTAEAIEPAPELTGEATRLVQGVINLDADGRLVMLLDPDELLTRAERGLLEAFQADARQANS